MTVDHWQVGIDVGGGATIEVSVDRILGGTMRVSLSEKDSDGAVKTQAIDFPADRFARLVAEGIMEVTDR